MLLRFEANGHYKPRSNSNSILKYTGSKYGNLLIQTEKREIELTFYIQLNFVSSKKGIESFKCKLIFCITGFHIITLQKKRI